MSCNPEREVRRGGAGSGPCRQASGRGRGGRETEERWTRVGGGDRTGPEGPQERQGRPDPPGNLTNASPGRHGSRAEGPKLTEEL